MCNTEKSDKEKHEEIVKQLVERKIRIINNAIISLSFLEHDLKEIKDSESEDDLKKIEEMERKLTEIRKRILSV